jgi:hypothetical protein
MEKYHHINEPLPKKSSKGHVDPYQQAKQQQNSSGECILISFLL